MISLRKVEIPEGVESIEENAFSECENLESVKIPESVTNIQNDIFDGSSIVILYVYADSKGHEYAEQNGQLYILEGNTINSGNKLPNKIRSNMGYFYE